MINEDTIVAIATPPGFGGVGIVRLSGQQAYAITTQLTHGQIKPFVTQVKKIRSPSGDILDTGLVLYFKAPHSFTGEEVIEFQGHGSSVVLQQIVKACLESGARLAEPGEFSLRAFLNGKIDLIQAEAVADLIHASSEQAAKMAMSSLTGVFSKKVTDIHDALIEIRVFIEAMLDFSEEEVDFLSDHQVKTKIQTLLDEVNTLISEARQGALMREGIKVVISGAPNAGKSTLMNLLAQRDVAIVTDVAGTTRDLIKENMILEGLPLTLVDTAGLRETTCGIEKAGIERALQVIQQADLVLQVIDITCPKTNHDDLLPKGVKILKVFNKIDLCDTRPVFSRRTQSDEAIQLSCKTNAGLDDLKKAILKAVGFQPSEGLFMARFRHVNALHEARAHLISALEELQLNPSLELVAESLRATQTVLAEITGVVTADDLLGAIFSTFCIGK